MKQKLLYILMMITALLGGNGEAWAADDWGDLPVSDKSLSEGSNSWPWSSDDRYKDIVIRGIPGILSFGYDATDSAINEYWSISTSSDGSNFQKIWESENNSGTGSIELPADTKYVRFLYSGTLKYTYSNISITERRYLTAN